ncbi:MAG: RNA polymerase sigma factor [Oscillospiraceae bacterium]
MIKIDDEEIIDLYWSRNERAITETDKKYRNKCISVARNILSDLSDAEECLNDTYLTAWNLMPPERPLKFPSFLYKIIRNHSLNRLQYKGSKKRKNEYNLSIDEINESISFSENAESRINEIELAELLNKFLESLDTEKRVIFIRRYWYFDAYSDIARRCSLTEDNVRMILMRIRKKLREFLIENEVFW